MDVENIWGGVCTTKDRQRVGWHADHSASCLEFIDALALPSSASLINLGGGASTLVDDLLARGYENITVLDLSSIALQISRYRVGQAGDKVSWVAANVLEYDFPTGPFDLWHDRGVFHFIIGDEHRTKYARKVAGAVKHGGYFLVSVFADDGPEMCCGVKVRRHSEQQLEDFFAKDFEVVKSTRSSSFTPSGAEQRFVDVLMRRI
jgi:SAM-dependent methyltransferase